LNGSSIRRCDAFDDGKTIDKFDLHKGVRDAGVEGYGQFPDGSEHGLQAKFFDGSPDEGQLGQTVR